MKLWAILLNLYLVLLSGMPCGDRSECEFGKEPQVSMAVNHDGHQHSSETCTPFCSCSCCAASVIIQSAPQYDFSLPRHRSVAFHAPVAPLSHGHKAIWQPPKIG